MSDVALIEVDGRVRTQWRVESLLLTIPVAAALTVVSTLVSWHIAVRIGIVAVGIAFVLVRLLIVNARYRHWRYGLGDDVLVLQHGVWIRRLSMTPYYRVQNVDVTAGPFERRLGLKRLSISTASASTDATIPGLDAADADRLRERILERAGRDAAV